MCGKAFECMDANGNWEIICVCVSVPWVAACEHLCTCTPTWVVHALMSLWVCMATAAWLAYPCVSTHMSVQQAGDV